MRTSAVLAPLGAQRVLVALCDRRLDDRVPLFVHPTARVHRFTSLSTMTSYLSSHSCDAVVLDLAQPSAAIFATIAAVRGANAHVPVLVLSDEATEPFVADRARGLCFARRPESDEALESLLDRVIAVDQHALEEDAGGDGADEAIYQSQVIVSTRALHRRFDAALAETHVVFQPVVSLRDRRVCAFESLMRCRHEAFPNPLVLFDAAERLSRLEELGRRARALTARELSRAPEDVIFLVNVHVRDLFDEELCSDASPLAALSHRVVFELTERASAHDIDGVAERVAALRERGYRIAIDDLGAGYSGLSALSLLEPEIVKIDMSIVRDVHRSRTKQRVVRSLLELARELGARVICEGIECAEERDALVELGCDWFQGYFFARPAAAFPEVRFE